MNADLKDQAFVLLALHRDRLEVVLEAVTVARGKGLRRWADSVSGREAGRDLARLRGSPPSPPTPEELARERPGVQLILGGPAQLPEGEGAVPPPPLVQRLVWRAWARQSQGEER